MNSIYLYLHRIMIRSINDKVGTILTKSSEINIDGILTRKHALWIISRYFKFVKKPMKEAILEDMIKLKLIKPVDRYRMQLINYDKSDPKNIDSGILLKILESGGE